MSHSPQSTDETAGPASPIVQLGLLVLLLVSGFGLAIAGSAFGVMDPLADDQGAGAVDIGESQITVSSDDTEVVSLVESEEITAVEIQEDEGVFTIETERNGSFTEEERNRIIEFVTQNTTVESMLDDFDAYEFEVEPLAEETRDEEDSNAIKAGSEISVNVTDGDSGDDGSKATKNETEIEEGTDVNFSVERVDTADNETVEVDRTSSYSDEKAVVSVRDKETGVERLTVRVDVINETVLSISEQ